MPLINTKKSRQIQDAADALYRHAVTQSRLPTFYASLGVPDSLDGRFDMMALHVFLLLSRLRAEGAAAKDLAQRLFDTMFDDMDHNLREMGVGDLGVGPRVKVMAKALYGRIAAYEAGLAGDDSGLSAALARNLFGTQPARDDQLATLCVYVRREAEALRKQSSHDLLAGNVSFGPVSDLVGRPRAAQGKARDA